MHDEIATTNKKKPFLRRIRRMLYFSLNLAIAIASKITHFSFIFEALKQNSIFNLERLRFKIELRKSTRS